MPTDVGESSEVLLPLAYAIPQGRSQGQKNCEAEAELCEAEARNAI